MTLALTLSCDGQHRGIPCRASVTFGPVDPEHPTVTFADAQRVALNAGWRRTEHHLPVHLCPKEDHDEDRKAKIPGDLP